MAQSVDQIQASIIADVQSQPELSGASSTSKRAIWRLWTWVAASSLALFQQLLDLFKSEVEGIVALAPPQTAAWLQNKVLQFQYSVTDPQALQLINLVPQYPVVNTSLQIITRASVKSTINNTVIVKVAKSEPPEALGVDELAGLQSYVNTLGVAGVFYSAISQASDKLYIQADVYYNGSYSAIILANVTAAIQSYLAALPFDGAMRINDLEQAMRGASGVSDVVLRNVVARANSTALVDGAYLVSNAQYVGRVWPTIAGYIVPETTSGSQLSDTLNFIPE